MNNDPKTPAPNSQHPQAKALGKNKFNKKNPPVAPERPVLVFQNATNPTPAPAAPPVTATAVPEPPKPTPKPAPPKEPSEPGKDKSYFELTIKLVGSDEPTFVVETPLTGSGLADKANAIAVARKRHPGKQMTILSSRIYTKSENALTEIAPGSTLSSLFGAPGEVTGDLIEVGRAVYDCRRGAIFLRNMRSHIGLAFRPSDGGLIVFSNRIVSNRLASELPLIVAEILGNGAREIEIYLKP